MSLTVLIAAYLEAEHVESIRLAVPSANLLHDPALLTPPATGVGNTAMQVHHRTPEQEAKYREWVAQADVIYGFDPTLAPDLPRIAPHLKWIQATNSGVAPAARAAGLDKCSIMVTTAAGVQGIPLAEHVLLSMLYFVKDVPARQQDQREKRWEFFVNRELRGMTMGLIGLGGAGKEIARLARAVGVNVIGVKRDLSVPPDVLGVDQIYPPGELHQVLPQCDFLVLMVPISPETDGLIGAKELALLPHGAVLINMARGAIVDEEALIAALNSGHMGGAALDATTIEPLPRESPLWEMKNVLLTPHSVGTVAKEHYRLTELFCKNLRLFTEGRPLINLLKF